MLCSSTVRVRFSVWLVSGDAQVLCYFPSSLSNCHVVLGLHWQKVLGSSLNCSLIHHVTKKLHREIWRLITRSNHNRYAKKCRCYKRNEILKRSYISQFSPHIKY